MPWKEMSMKSERLEFVTLAIEEGANMSELCRRYGISRVTGYKWRDRFVCSGELGLEEQSRRPLSCPHQSPAETEDRIVALRGEHPRWGGRKLRRLVQKEGLVKAPAASTVTKILSRHELLNEIDGAGQPRSFRRFERQSPNELWQMDFLNEANWDPLTVFDIIVSNPPYVKKSEQDSMAKHVLDFEPAIALFVPDEDPLIFYRKIALFSKTHLHKSGSLFLEINETLGKEVVYLFESAGYIAELKKDLQGKDRMLRVTNPG